MVDTILSRKWLWKLSQRWISILHVHSFFYTSISILNDTAGCRPDSNLLLPYFLLSFRTLVWLMATNRSPKRSLLACLLNTTNKIYDMIIQNDLKESKINCMFWFWFSCNILLAAFNTIIITILEISMYVCPYKLNGFEVQFVLSCPPSGENKTLCCLKLSTKSLTEQNQVIRFIKVPSQILCSNAQGTVKCLASYVSTCKICIAYLEGESILSGGDIPDEGRIGVLRGGDRLANVLALREGKLSKPSYLEVVTVQK